MPATSHNPRGGRPSRLERRRRPRRLVTEILRWPEEIEALAGAWDELADLSGQPYSSSAWLAAWARHVTPGEPLVAAVRDGDALVGAVPLAAERSATGLVRLRLLGSGTSTGVGPLARPGTDGLVARAAAPALAAAAPEAGLLAFEGIRAPSPWPAELARHWPGTHPRLLHFISTAPEPSLPLDAPSFDAWLAGKSANFRSQLRRVRRKLAARGVEVRRASTSTEVRGALEAFDRLHTARWRDRGGSGVVDDRVRAMLAEAAPGMVARGRLQLWSLDAEGETICSQVWLSTRETTTYWLGGFDDRWADAHVTFALIAAVVEEGYATGLRHVSLGEGGQDYKYRFASYDERLLWTTMPLVGPRLPLVLAALQARRARGAVGRRIGPEAAARARRLLRAAPRPPVARP